MAKMFYSLEEAAERLSKSTQEVEQLVQSGKLQEFRDRDRLVFKKDQVDMLAEPGTGAEDSGLIPLADSGAASGLGLSLEDSAPLSSSGLNLGGSGSGPGIAMDEPKDRSGISIFDTDSTEEGDPSAVTRITDTGGGGLGELTLDNVGSGSGLLDLTREGDDTSLGADLLQDVYSDQGEESAGGSQTQGASGLFEPTPAMSDVSMSSAAAAAPMAMVAAEPYDGTWSGIAGGLALGAVGVLTFSLAAVLFALIGGDQNPLVSMVSSNLMMWLGIFAGAMVFAAIIGLLVGKRSG
ncbi:MAG: hypothetical protein KF768_10345 [Phycisphaeraceae bacterium]|nr:hypothetical protein [Phycisphaeraceae bacterium]